PSSASELSLDFLVLDYKNEKTPRSSFSTFRANDSLGVYALPSVNFQAIPHRISPQSLPKHT
ncbi:hypothetical protein EBR11_07000, partial [bacterium]|nr:hypothetical protein [bacterium]